MRIRNTDIFRRARRALRRRRGEFTFFAWLPVKLDNGTWVWLEKVNRTARPNRGTR